MHITRFLVFSLCFLFVTEKAVSRKVIFWNPRKLILFRHHTRTTTKTPPTTTTASTTTTTTTTPQINALVTPKTNRSITIYCGKYCRRNFHTKKYTRPCRKYRKGKRKCRVCRMHGQCAAQGNVL